MASVAVFLMIAATHPATVHAQILDTGEGYCKRCGHSERDTQRYVNSFLNQMFFPDSMARRAAITASLYLLSGTYTIQGGRSPDPDYASVTIAITAELKGAIPTGNFRLVVTTPGGKTSTETYAIGDKRFKMIGILRERERSGSGAGGGGRTKPHAGGSSQARPSNGSGAKCSHKRREDRGNETIAWCSRD